MKKTIEKIIKRVPILFLSMVLLYNKLYIPFVVYYVLDIIVSVYSKIKSEENTWLIKLSDKADEIENLKLQNCNSKLNYSRNRKS